MKKFLLLFTVVALGVASCNEKEHYPNNQDDRFNKNQIASVINPYPFDLPTSSINYSNVSVYSGRLRFTSVSALETILEQLDEEYESWNDSFVTYYSDTILDPDTLMWYLDYVDEQIDFNDDLTSERFESELSYSSLRAKIADEMTIWLANNILDEASDPDEDVVILESIRTICNEEHEYIIADSVYKYTDSGLVKIFIDDLDRSLLIADSIEDGLIVPWDSTSSALDDLGISPFAIFGRKKSEDQLDNMNNIVCTVGKNSESEEVTSGNRRIKCKLVVRVSNVGPNSFAQIKCYSRRRVWNGWRKSRTSVFVKNNGAMTADEDAADVAGISLCQDFPFTKSESESSTKKCTAKGFDGTIGTCRHHGVHGEYHAFGIVENKALDIL
jgi:hypothetical protein